MTEALTSTEQGTLLQLMEWTHIGTHNPEDVGSSPGTSKKNLTCSSDDGLVRDNLSFVRDGVTLAREPPDDVHDVRSRHLQRRDRRFHRRRGVDLRRLRRRRHRLVITDEEDFDGVSDFAI